MQDTTKVGKYVNDDIGYLVNPKLNRLLNSILEKIRLCDNKDEKKAILKKLKLTRLEVFADSAFIINHILNSKNYKEKIIELADKLDIYIDKNKISYDTVIDFSNDLSSKMKFHSTFVARNIKDSLSEEEIKEVVAKINENDKKMIDRVLSNYRKWSLNIKDDKDLYEYFKEFEPTSKSLVSALLDAAIKKIEEEKTRADRIYAMNVDREIKLYNQKHKSIHRIYNNTFE